jgi:hypothetical protein
VRRDRPGERADEEAVAETVVVDCEERRRTYAGFGLTDGSWDG